MKKYTDKHEWVEIDDDVAIIGISEHAAEELGDITYVELPELQIEIEKDFPFAVIESVKAATDVFSPVNGTIVDVNKELELTPELINQSAEDAGWICTVTEFSEHDLEDLMSEDEYKTYLQENEDN
ncbi:MAG: glycine cleavage system protein GcvH [Verrucomicrobiota bacterium]|nr:glycine cleavage system protein GcvH [Verrucomicrobiota bacterium]